MRIIQILIFCSVFTDFLFSCFCVNYSEHIGFVDRLPVSGYRGQRFVSQQHQFVVFLSKTFYQHGFSRLCCEMSTRWGREGHSML